MGGPGRHLISRSRCPELPATIAVITDHAELTDYGLGFQADVPGYTRKAEANDRNSPATRSWRSARSVCAASRASAAPGPLVGAFAAIRPDGDVAWWVVCWR